MITVKRILSVMLVLSASWSMAAEPVVADMMDRVRQLTSPAFAGRGSGTPGGHAAAETLAAWFADSGLEPAFGDAWLQGFSLHGEGFAGEDLTGLVAHNVAGILPGGGDLAGRFVVVGAHHDHLGRLEPALAEAPPPDPDQFYPGANDNASGVTILVELARLAAGDGSRRSVLFVAFGAEEVGLQGSAHFVDHLPIALESIDAMINLDTVGQMNDGRLYVSGLGTSALFPSLVEAARPPDLEISLAQGGWSGSDHMVFNTREVPVLFLFGGAYPQYNRPTDVAESLDRSALEVITTFAAALVEGVRTVEGPFPWVMVGQKELRSGEDAAQNRQTWLGTLPDFTEGVSGYKLAGVFDESPAALAGLQKGDVLTSLGGEEVSDLATFTRALRSFGPGDLVEITADRESRHLKFTVVLGNRADRE